MKKLFTAYIFIISISCSLMCRADVFTLSPFGVGGQGGSGSLHDALGGKKLWAEPIVVNGVKTSMSIRLLQHDLKEYFLTLNKQFPNALFRTSLGALLVEIKHKDGSVERIYLIELDGIYPVIQFSMKFSDGLPGKENVEWPHELPITPGATPETTISLPDRKVSYGTFTTPFTPEAAMSDVTSTLKAAGWTSLKEGVFIKNNPMLITMVAFSSDKSGKTRGFVLKRSLK